MEAIFHEKVRILPQTHRCVTARSFAARGLAVRAALPQFAAAGPLLYARRTEHAGPKNGRRGAPADGRVRGGKRGVPQVSAAAVRQHGRQRLFFGTSHK